jgi:hypothetical protein
MTTVEASTPPAAARRSPPLLICALAALAVVVGWLAYLRWVYHHLEDRVVGWRLFGEHYSMINLATIVLGVLPFAIALLLWGRRFVGRIGGALVALAAAGYLWGLQQALSDHIDTDFPSQAWVTAYQWAYELVLPTLVALAWGVARRRGRIWTVGLIMAPWCASLGRELALHSTWWRHHVVLNRHGYAWLLEPTVVWPAVAAAVVCWLIDAAAGRRTHPNRVVRLSRR